MNTASGSSSQPAIGSVGGSPSGLSSGSSSGSLSGLASGSSGGSVSNNLRTALVLMSIALVFFLGVIGKRVFLGP